MGTWGPKAFENDAALDWAADLELNGAEAICVTLQRVVDTDADAYLDADDGVAAVAAAEVIAAALDGARAKLPAAVLAWLDANAGQVDAQYRDLASRAVQRVLEGESELASLWDEGGEDNAWRVATGRLLERLGGPPSTKRSRSTQPRDKGQSTLQMKQALFSFLQLRRLVPTATQRERILASNDAEELRRWLSLAIEVQSVAALLDPP